MDIRARSTARTTGWRSALTAACLLLSVATASLAADWQPLPRFGGPVLALAAAEDAPLLYAGTMTAGPVRSSNGGDTWTQGEAPEPLRILRLVVDPRNPRVAFAAARTPFEASAGVLRSVDGGAHWEPVNQGLQDPGSDQPLFVLDLAIDPFEAQKVYAATHDGLYRSLNRGESWERIGLAGSSVLAVAVHPTRPDVLFASVYLNQNSLGIMVSRDGGATWTVSDAGIEGTPAFGILLFHPDEPETLFALGSGWPLHVSRDGGATWTKLGRPLVSMTFGPNGTLFGAPYNVNGILKSVDGGFTWTRTGPLPDRISQVLAAHGRLYAAGRLGIWVSSDNGAHWRPSSRGLSARTVSDLIESGGELFASFAEGAFASRTDGTIWRELRDVGDPQVRIARILAAGPNVLYALEDGDARPVFIRSTDGGATWTELASPGLGGTFSSFAVDPRRPAVLYAGSTEDSGNDHPFCHLARSTDRGSSWTCLAGEASVEEIKVEPRTSTPYLIGAGTMLALVNGGTTLEGRSAGLPAYGTLTFTFDPRRAGTLYAGTTEGVFKTTNGGRSWSRTSRGLPGGAMVFAVAVDPQQEGVVYAGLQGRVYRSLDAGRTWQQLGTGLPSEAPVVELLPSASDPSRLYAVAAGHGIYVLDPSN